MKLKKKRAKSEICRLIKRLQVNKEYASSFWREWESREDWYSVQYVLRNSCLYFKGPWQLFKGLTAFIVKIFIPRPLETQFKDKL